MKKNQLVAGVVLAIFSGAAYAGQEVGIRNVFAPSVGYDDNDQIEVVVDGVLPNGCYQLEKTVVAKSGARELFFKQFATRKPIAACAVSDEQLPAYLKLPQNYTLPITLGHLKAGTYRLAFAHDSGQRVEAKMAVEPAQNKNIDNTLYAPVTGVFVPEIVYEDESVEVGLTGVFGSFCLDFLSAPKIKYLGQTIVILPEMKTDETSDCRTAPRPLTRVVSLGKLTPGRYLIHVRSTTGKAVLRAFSVLNAKDNPDKNEGI